jgi:hypothetical protein
MGKWGSVEGGGGGGDEVGGGWELGGRRCVVGVRVKGLSVTDDRRTMQTAGNIKLT